MTDLDLPTTFRYKLLTLLGGKCRICLESNPSKIELDHIYGDGAIERTKYGNNDKIWEYYLNHKELAFERLQPLCKHCHRIKTSGIKKISLMDGIKAYEKLSYIMTSAFLDNQYSFDMNLTTQKLMNAITITEEDAKYLVELYYSDHTYFTLNTTHTNHKKSKFLMIIKELEGTNRECVPREILIKKLIETGEFTEPEANNYIRRYLREADIYESKPNHYNLV